MLPPARRALSVRIVLSSLFFTFIFQVLVNASTTDIIITEINYDPQGADEGKEWLEIYNTGTGSATLVGGASASSWKIYDGSNHNLATTAARGSMTLAGGEYAVIAQSDSTFIAQYPDYSGSVIKSSGMNLGNSLHDEEETVALRVGTTGSFWSRINYKKSWGGAGNGRTLEKKNINGVDDSTNWVESSVNGGTPGKPYSLPTYPSEIYLNEYMPYPESGNEWVEIYNDNSESKTLTGWQIDDIKDGGSSPKSFTVTVAGKGYAKIELAASFFNNDGDSVRLLRPDGTVAEETAFTVSYKGNALAKDAGGNWQETKKPTPGEANVIESPVHEDTVRAIKNLTIGSRISLTAYATVPPDLLGDNDFYVHDGGEGIKIHCTCSLTSADFNLGDKVKVSSSLEQSDEEKYIKTDAVEIISKSQTQVETDEIKTGEVTENHEGNLVKLTGLYESSSGDTFYINDGTGSVKVYIKDSTGIVKPTMGGGDLVRVSGLVSQSGYLKDGSPNYRVLPRYQGDIEILNDTPSSTTSGSVGAGEVLGAVTVLPQTGTTQDAPGVFFFLFFSGLNLKLFLRGKHELD